MFVIFIFSTNMLKQESSNVKISAWKFKLLFDDFKDGLKIETSS